MKYKKKVIAYILSTALVISTLLSNLYNVTISNAADYGMSNPCIEDGITTWDCIYFGHYWQNKYNPYNPPEEPEGDTIYTDTDGTEFFYDVIDGEYYKNDPIKWRVLSVNGDEAFLLADQNLYDYCYDRTARSDVTWETSSIRSWLNNSFYNYAFFAFEREAITSTLVKSEDNAQWCTGNGNNTNDKIYILSFDDVTNPIYGFNSGYKESETRISKLTDNSIVYDGWWLRTQGSTIWSLMFVDNMGEIQMSGRYSISMKGIRPCMHIDLSKATWTKADSVSAEVGEVVPIPTSTPTPTHTPTSSPTPEPTQTPNPKVTATPETPKTVTAPSKVKKLSVKNKKGKKAVLSWKKVKDAKGYQIQYATDVAFSKKKTKSTKKTKITIKKLKSKKAYSFRVCAYVLDGKKKLYGKWSKVKKVKIKK